MGQRQSVVKAAGKGDFSRVKRHLKKKGKAALYEKEPGGWTALHKAARAGKVEMVGFLLENNADMEATDASMCTPLHCACWKGHVDVVEHLVQAGANPTALTESGWSPLHTAAFRGHATVAELLLTSTDVDASQRDLMGYTPLELAEREEVVRVLEQHVYKAIEEALDQAEASLQAKMGAVPSGESFGEPRVSSGEGVGGLDVNALLGLPADASGEEVKAAYRRLAGKHRQSSVRSTSAARRMSRTRRLSSSGLGIPPPPPGRKSPEAGRASPETVGRRPADEDPRQRVIRVLTSKGYDHAQVLKALDRVGVCEEEAVERKLREWGLAPKSTGTFKRKWKGGGSSRAGFSSLSRIESGTSSAGSLAGSPAPPPLPSGAPTPVPRRKGSRMSNASDAELGASALLDEIRFESTSGTSSRAAGGFGDGGDGRGMAGGAVTAAGVSASLLEEQNAMLRAEMEGRVGKGTASRAKYLGAESALGGGVSREQARDDASEWGVDGAVAAGLGQHFPRAASKTLLELQAASRAHPSPSPGPSSAAATPMPGVSTPAPGQGRAGQGWEVLPMSVLKRVTPEGWKPFLSTTHGLVYWHHKATKETSWSPPPGTPSLEVAQQMAAEREKEKKLREEEAAATAQREQAKAAAFSNEAAKAMSMVYEEVRKGPAPPSVSTPSVRGGASRLSARTPGAGGERDASRAPSVLSRASGASSVMAMSTHSGEVDVKELQRAAPKGWKVYMSTTHRKPYWYNKRTRETRWSQPDQADADAHATAAAGGDRRDRGEREAESKAKATDESQGGADSSAEASDRHKEDKASGSKSALPKGWKEYVSKTTGKVYYYHKRTNETRWTRPELEGGDQV